MNHIFVMLRAVKALEESTQLITIMSIVSPILCAIQLKKLSASGENEIQRIKALEWVLVFGLSSAIFGGLIIALYLLQNII